MNRCGGEANLKARLVINHYPQFYCSPIGISFLLFFSTDNNKIQIFFCPFQKKSFVTTSPTRMFSLVGNWHTLMSVVLFYKVRLIQARKRLKFLFVTKMWIKTKGGNRRLMIDLSPLIGCKYITWWGFY